MKEHKTKIILGLVLVGLVVLLALPTINPENEELINRWNDAGVECLDGHGNMAIHYHPTLTINLGDESKRISSEIGVVSNCMAEVHTHDSSGTLHVESVQPGKQFLLSQFFEVWGESLDWPGYELEEATANGQVIDQPSNIILQDGVDIVLNYEESTSTTDSATSSNSSS